MLPAPRNDFEIVVPEDETLTEQEPEEQTIFPDQAEIDANRESELKAKSWYFIENKYFLQWNERRNLKLTFGF